MVEWSGCLLCSTSMVFLEGLWNSTLSIAVRSGIHASLKEVHSLFFWYFRIVTHCIDHECFLVFIFHFEVLGHSSLSFSQILL